MTGKRWHVKFCGLHKPERIDTTSSLYVLLGCIVVLHNENVMRVVLSFAAKLHTCKMYAEAKIIRQIYSALILVVPCPMPRPAALCLLTLC